MHEHPSACPAHAFHTARRKPTAVVSCTGAMPGRVWTGASVHLTGQGRFGCSPARPRHQMLMGHPSTTLISCSPHSPARRMHARRARCPHSEPSLTRSDYTLPIFHFFSTVRFVAGNYGQPKVSIRWSFVRNVGAVQSVSLNY